MSRMGPVQNVYCETCGYIHSTLSLGRSKPPRCPLCHLGYEEPHLEGHLLKRHPLRTELIQGLARLAVEPHNSAACQLCLISEEGKGGRES